MHSSRASQCHLAHIAVYFMYFFALYELLRSLDILSKYLIRIPIENVWSSLGQLGSFPNSPNNPGSFSTFSAANQQIVVLEAQLYQLLLCELRMILEVLYWFNESSITACHEWDYSIIPFLVYFLGLLPPQSFQHEW